MAEMIPKDVEEFKTPGERKFYYFLKTSAKPDNKIIAWYLPEVNGKEPDFIIYSEDVGILIFEVKDWTIYQIKEANNRFFEIYRRDKFEKTKNPLQQGRDYREALMDKIREDGRLVSQEHFRNPKIPIDFGVVFPNITRSEFTRKGLGKVIAGKKVLFWDDINPDSDFSRDYSGSLFVEFLRRMFSVKFIFNITYEELMHLKGLISPVVRIRLPQRKSVEIEEQLQQIKILDNNQEAIARKFEGGYRIIEGPSGCGKTLVLVHKAVLLQQYNPKIKTILFLCFNITLVNYIKRLLTEQKVSLGEDGAQVYHFFDFCSKILGKAIFYERDDDDYYRNIVNETLDAVKISNITFDAILADEGQDLTDEMFQIITYLLNEKINNLTIALDESQNIYGRKLSWLELFDKDKIHRLTYVYRNTEQIVDFVSKLPDKDKDKENAKERATFPKYCEFLGPEPYMKKLESIDEIISFVGYEIEKIRDERQYPLSEIAVIYGRTLFDDSRSCPELLGKKLLSRGIMFKWASEDYPSKRTYDITTESVTLSTIHSVKGLDFLCVFLVGLDLIEGEPWDEEQLLNIAYVAITRAKHRLFIPYMNQENFIIKKLLSDL